MTLSTYAARIRSVIEKHDGEVSSSSSIGISGKIKIRRSKATISMVEGFTMLTVSKKVASRKKLRSHVPKSGVWPVSIADEGGSLDLGRQFKELTRRIKLIKES